jgi:hypothetical protein
MFPIHGPWLQQNPLEVIQLRMVPMSDPLAKDLRRAFRDDTRRLKLSMIDASQPASAAAVRFINYNNGNGGDYHLQASSHYKGKGTTARTSERI